MINFVKYMILCNDFPVIITHVLVEQQVKNRVILTKNKNKNKNKNIYLPKKHYKKITF